MLDIEELAGNTITASDVAAITPEVISEAFETIVHKKTVFAQLYKVNRDILNKPGKQVIFPGATAAGGFTVGVAENTDITGLNASVGIAEYNATTVSVEKIGGYLYITKEAIKYAMRDVIKENIFETGLQYKEIVDDMAYYAMMFGQHTKPDPTTVSVSSATSASLAPNVIEIVSAPSGVTAVDYVNGTIYFDSAVTGNVVFYAATKPGVSRWAAQPGSTSTGITAWGILDGKAAMVAEGRDPKVVVMSYNDIPNLLYDEKVNFLDASAYGNNEPLLNAEVGKLWGIKVITESRHLPEGVAVLVDTDRMGYDVHKEELQSYRDDKPERDAIAYYFYAERGFGVKDTLALGLVLGGTSTYPGTHPTS